MPYTDHRGFVIPLIRAVGSLSAASALVLATTSMSFAQVASAPCEGYPVIRLENPAPGTGVPRGAIIVKGVAYDPAAATGAGISSVNFFLGNREEGGLFRGAATLNQPNPFMPTGQFANAGFSRSVSFAIPAGPKMMYAYARSSVTGRERWVAVPVSVGGGGPIAASAPVQQCSPVAPVTAAAAAIAAAPAPQAAISPAAILSRVTGAPVLIVSGPTSGTFPKARIVFRGVAYDASSPSGTGVESVTAFLGNRNEGARYLGAATRNQPNPEDPNPIFRNAGWSLSANLSNVGTGGKMIYFYAMGSNGQESRVIIPVVIG